MGNKKPHIEAIIEKDRLGPGYHWTVTYHGTSASVEEAKLDIATNVNEEAAREAKEREGYYVPGQKKYKRRSDDIP